MIVGPWPLLTKLEVTIFADKNKPDLPKLPEVH